MPSRSCSTTSAPTEDGAVIAESGEGYEIQIVGDGYTPTIASIGAPWAIDDRWAGDGVVGPTPCETFRGVGVPRWEDWVPVTSEAVTRRDHMKRSGIFSASRHRSAVLAASTTTAMASTSPPDASIQETVDAALVAAGQDLTPQEVAAVPAEIVINSASSTYQLGTDALQLTTLDAENSIVQGREAGIQALTALNEGSSTAELQVDLPDGAAITESGEGYDIQIVGDGHTLTIASIDAPWAIDANGQSLPTTYDLNGGIISQHVNTSGATYPIVANPLITIGLAHAPQGPGPYLNLTGQVTNSIYAGVLAATQLAPAAICVNVANLPARVRGIVTALCGFFGAATAGTVLNNVLGALRASPWRSGQCYQMRVPGSGPFVATSAGNCA